MSVRELIVKAPVLCGAKHAEKHSKLNSIAFDEEIRNNAFPRKDGESARDRIAFLFAWESENPAKQEYCLKLGELATLSHYAISHNDDVSAIEANDLAVELSTQESLYPDVAAALTVQQASIMDFWY